MGTSVSFKIVSKDKEFKNDGARDEWIPPYKDGQIIFVQKQKKIYLDFYGERTCYTQDASSSSGGMNYLGIVDEKPTTSTVKIGGDSVEAHEKDMVVFGTKEYIWRKDENGILGWYEIGDEESPTWS